MRKLAVFFPGIGYTVDKPLMYYSRKIAAELSYEIKLLPYGGFPPKIHGDLDKMRESFKIAMQQAEEMLSGTDLNVYGDILFIGKSIGTVVAAKIALLSGMEDKIRFIFYTPLEDTFFYHSKTAVVFTGSNDPWTGAGQSPILAYARENGYPCFLIEDANHSLETGNAMKDIQNLQMIMEETRRFIG